MRFQPTLRFSIPSFVTARGSISRTTLGFFRIRCPISLEKHIRA